MSVTVADKKVCFRCQIKSELPAEGHVRILVRSRATTCLLGYWSSTGVLCTHIDARKRREREREKVTIMTRGIHMYLALLRLVPERLVGRPFSSSSRGYVANPHAPQRLLPD